MEQFKLILAERSLVLEVGELAQQAGGAVLVRYGDSIVLVTATASAEPRDGIDFFPLTVDYEERMYAAGKIPGGFIKREGRPTEKAILAARLTDRPLRPLFPKGFRNSVHIVATVLSVDQDCPPEALAIIGASAALSISDIPFAEPVAAVVVGLVDGEYVINPNAKEREKSTLHLVVAGTKEAIMMVEAGAAEVSEENLLEAIIKGHEVIKEIVSLQESMLDTCAKQKREVPLFEPAVEIVEKIKVTTPEKIEAALLIEEKLAREEKIASIKKETKEALLSEYPEKAKDINACFENLLKEIVRKRIVEKEIRPDGRKPDEIRPVSCKAGYLPRTHGSALFNRGQTQVLNVCTLGSLGNVQKLDGLGVEETQRFMHHYNFPPYSVGEAGFMRGPGRREIGHGALAEKALLPVIPTEEDFPYAIRLVSEVIGSNGSSSMGSVCAASLSLMDAGVPIKKPVSGIAMGLISGEKTAILTDIQGMEDYLGDMDFKVAGTRDGITALQMDIKTKGLSRELLATALKRAKEGYLSILEKMLSTIDAPRPEMSPYAPRILTLQIDPEKIRDIIGPGGKIINKIISETSTEIDIKPDGSVFIAALDAKNGEKAKEIIENLVKEAEPGVSYLGKVTRTENYGAFVEILPGKSGLIHISHLAHERVNKTEDVVKVGDEIMVKVLDIDDRGRINLSRKALLTDTGNSTRVPHKPTRVEDNKTHNKYGKGGRKFIK